MIKMKVIEVKNLNKEFITKRKCVKENGKKCLFKKQKVIKKAVDDISFSVEAGEALGGTKMQIITKVLLPEARSSLIGGVAVTLVSILGYTSFAYNISANGLIAGIWTFYKDNPDNYSEEPIFWILIIVVIVLVQVIQELGLVISKKLDKRRIA